MDKSLNLALDSAWKQIQNYCKENYACITIRDVQFCVYSDPYMWIDFGVTPKGDAYFVRGNHSKGHTSNDADWYYHPSHKFGYEPLKYRELETIIKKWPEIKAMLAEKFNQEKYIFNFEV